MSQERRALWVLVCLVLSACVLLAPPADAATTSTWTGAVDNNWYSDSNWIGISPGGGGLGFFNDMAIFGPTGLATPQVNPNPMPFDMGTILYTAGAKPYTLTIKSSSRFNIHNGIINASSVPQTIIVESRESFSFACACLRFQGTAGILSSPAGVIIIIEGGGGSTPSVDFDNTSSAGPATVQNNSRLVFNDSSAAGSARITNIGGLELVVTNFRDTSNARTASIVNEGSAVVFADNLRLRTSFQGNSTAGAATIVNRSAPSLGQGGLTRFAENASAGAATINNNGVFGAGTGSGRHGMTTFQGNSTAGNATITNSSGTLAGGETVFSDFATAGSATIFANGSASGVGGVVRFVDFATGGTATAVIGLNATLDISGLAALGMGIGSIAGPGNYILGSKQFLVGSNNTSTIVSGLISGDGGALRKTGIGSLRLDGANTYTGFTSIFNGALVVNNLTGSATGTGRVFVNAGGTLAGGNPAGTRGFIGGLVSVANGGRIAPGLTPATAGLMTMLSDLELRPTSVIDFQFLTPDLFTATSNDRLAVAGDLTLDGILDIDSVPGFGGAGAYLIVAYGGDLTDNGLILGDLPPGADPSEYLIDVSHLGQVILRVGPTQAPVPESRVPEPASALLLLAGGLLLVGHGLAKAPRQGGRAMSSARLSLACVLMVCLAVGVAHVQTAEAVAVPSSGPLAVELTFDGLGSTTGDGIGRTVPTAAPSIFEAFFDFTAQKVGPLPDLRVTGEGTLELLETPATPADRVNAVLLLPAVHVFSDAGLLFSMALKLEGQVDTVDNSPTALVPGSFFSLPGPVGLPAPFDGFFLTELTVAGTAIPVPASLLLLGTGLAGLGAGAWRRWRG